MQPKLLIIGGSNGSGKTTFANEFLQHEPLIYLGADAIAYELDAKNPMKHAFQAGRLFSERLADHIECKTSLIIESTLSGLSLKKHIQRAKEQGYRVELVYLFLDSTDLCNERIQERVAKGGHFVPPEDVKRRFYRSNFNFVLYKELACEWGLYSNSYERYESVAIGENSQFEIFSPDLFTRFDAIGCIMNGISAERYERFAKYLRIGNSSVKKAQEENCKLGIPNCYSINGVIVSDKESKVLAKKQKVFLTQYGKI